MPSTAIGLGANLPSIAGEPLATIHAAMERLAACGHITARSGLYRTAPVGYLDQPVFMNAVALLDTELPPPALLDALLRIEHDFGRDRALGPPKGPRTLDLDLLLYGDVTCNDPDLTLPHPAMHQRRFVLAPLVEVAPGWMHPVLQQTMAALLAALPHEDSAVTRISA